MIKTKMQKMQKRVSSKKIKFQDYNDVDSRIVFTEEINKIALNSGDGKRM